MSNLLSELEAVVGLADKATPGEWASWHVEGSATQGEAFAQVIGPKFRQRDKALGFAPDDAHYMIAASNLFRTHHAEIAAAVRDGQLLDFMERECIAIRCEATDDDDVYYDAVDFYMAEPKERIVGTGKTPREALIAAMSAREGEG